MYLQKLQGESYTMKTVMITLLLFLFGRSLHWKSHMLVVLGWGGFLIMCGREKKIDQNWKIRGGVISRIFCRICGYQMWWKGIQWMASNWWSETSTKMWMCRERRWQLHRARTFKQKISMRFWSYTLPIEWTETTFLQDRRYWKWMVNFFQQVLLKPVGKFA
jgi:hypothetical protein